MQWDIVPKELKRKVARNLAKQVEAAGFHLDVGVLGAKAILNALSENGYIECNAGKIKWKKKNTSICEKDNWKIGESGWSMEQPLYWKTGI